MSGWIVLLVIFGLINAFSSPGKKKKKAQTRRQGSAQQAAAPNPSPQPKPQQTRVPYTKEEWAAFLNELNDAGTPTKAAPKKSKAKNAAKKSAPQSSAQTRPDPFEDRTLTYEGESHEEHAKHLRRIEEEEARYQQERDALDELRSANLEKLRTAVVMSEVLGKPVSLRPRVGYRR